MIKRLNSSLWFCVCVFVSVCFIVNQVIYNINLVKMMALKRAVLFSGWNGWSLV